jgi:hypothetical protein
VGDDDESSANNRCNIGGGMTTHYVIKNGQETAIEVPDLAVKPIKRRTKRIKPFAQVELEETANAAKAMGTPRALIFAMLKHLAWQSKGKPFPLTNAVLKKYGISREVKRKALVALEAKGLIRVERHRTRSPVVTWIVNEEGPKLSTTVDSCRSETVNDG